MKIKKLKERSVGFTLVEMIITMVIVVILSAISVPIYKDYVKKSKISEGYVLLSAIRSAQERYYTEYGTFYAVGGDTCNEEVLAINAMTNKYFTIFNVNVYRTLDKYRAYVHGAAEAQPYINMQYNLTSVPTFYN